VGRARRRGGPTRTRPGCPVSALMPRGLCTELVGLCHQGARSALAEHPISVQEGHRPVNQAPGFRQGRARSVRRGASLPWERLATQWERRIPPVGEARNASGEMHPSYGRGSQSSGREASLPWERLATHRERCIPAMGERHPSHGRRASRPRERGIPPMGDEHPCHGRRASLPMRGSR
jgi:hypothetical protein